MTLVVVGLGGNALLKRGEDLTAANQRANASIAARALASVAGRHSLVVTHGNGPQVGLLALQAESYTPVEPYPLDVLGAESEGMIGYMIEQELRSVLPDRSIATVLTMVEVDRDDPAFDTPTKPIGPLYEEAEAERIRRLGRWTLARDGDHWRRIVASPAPQRVLELQPIAWLLERGGIVICAGGGGIPTVCGRHGRLEGAEAVIDKDRASALLASELGADVLVLATDVDAVYTDWREPHAHPLRDVTPDGLSGLSFDAGTMGPKVEAACTFAASREGRRAAIGALDDVEAMVAGTAGTQVSLKPSAHS